MEMPPRVLAVSNFLPLWILLAAPLVHADGPVITEFMAAKTKILADEDGEYPDWIEILNTGTAELNLAGYYLTDNRDVRTRWKMPDVMLGPQRFLVVFASGKDRTKAGGPLHTNFRLSAAEYLALVAPDGRTVVSGFGPRYPLQVDHVSYGVAMRASTKVLVSAGAPARVLVPVDDSLGVTWTEPDFDDRAWIHGTTGIGFDRKPIPTYTSLLQTDIQREMAGVNSGAYIRLPFTLSDTAVMALVLAIKYDDGFAAYLNSGEVARRNAPSRLSWDASAASRRRDEEALLSEEIDLADHLDLLRMGTNVLAIHGLNSSRTDEDFLIAVELRVAHTSVDLGSERYFAAPTPGGPNSEGAAGVAEDSEFTPPGGLFSAPFQLKLETASINAVIKYTLDGSSPTEASATYSAPLPIRATTVVRTRVYAPNLIPSPPITQTYLAMDGNDTAIRDFSSNLPIVVLETFGRGVTDRAYTTANAVIIDTANGRQVPPDFQLTMSSILGAVYYTVDGSDPRQEDGNIAPSANVYTVPIPITGNVRIKARVKRGEVWSHAKESTFVVEMPPLVISEILFAPPAPPDGSGFQIDDFEFIELKNIGSAELELSGFRFIQGISYEFSSGAVTRLRPGAYGVLVKNLRAFSSRYSAADLTILGQFTGSMADSGERIALEGPVGETIHDFRYSSTWYPETLTGGHSLVVVDDSAPRESWGRRESWRPSKLPGGSPGLADGDESVPGRQRPGDYNQDGRLNLTDPINLLGHLFAGTPWSLPCGGDLAPEGNLALLDADGDAQLELTDVIVLLRYLFQGGPPHILGTSCVSIQGCPDACLP